MSCLFCRIVQGELPSDRVYEDEHCLAFKDINPGAPVHILLIPKKHIPTLDAAQDEDQALLGHLMLKASAIAAENGLGDGFRTVINCQEAAGQTVFHLHLHLIGGRPLHWPPG